MYVSIPSKVSACSVSASTFSNDADTLSGPIPISKFSEYVQSINRKGRQYFDSEYKVCVRT